MSIDKNYSYTPTDEEAEKIDRAGLAAAWHELQPLNSDEIALSQQVLACLRAFKAVSAAIYGAEKTLKAAHPEARFISHYPEEAEIVCSAFMGLDMGSPDEIHPYSIAGARLVPLLKAAKALESMAEVHLALDESDMALQTLMAEETTMFAEAVLPANLNGPNAQAQLPPEREARRAPKARQRFGRSTAAPCYTFTGFVPLATKTETSSTLKGRNSNH